MNAPDEVIVAMVRRTLSERAGDVDGIATRPLGAPPVAEGTPWWRGAGWRLTGAVVATIVAVTTAAVLTMARPGPRPSAREVHVIGSASMPAGGATVLAPVAGEGSGSGAVAAPGRPAPTVAVGPPATPVPVPALVPPDPLEAPVPPAPLTVPAVAADGAGDGPVPAGFRPRSVSFASAQLGWVLGGAPCSVPPCTFLVRTDDGGRTWAAVPAPRAELYGGAAYSGGVSEVRFADARNGWAFGPDLYATHDGGETWIEVMLPGSRAGLTRVVSLEPAEVGGAVYAAVNLGGTSQLFRSDVTVERWAPVPGVSAGISVDMPRVLVAGAAVWVTEQAPNGSPYFFSPDGVAWEQRRDLPCQLPWASVAAAPGTGEVAVVCPAGGALGSEAKAVYLSGEGGRRFDRVSDAPLGGVLQGVARPGASTVVVAAASGASYLYATFDGGASWSTVLEASETGGVPWSDLRFVTAQRGAVLEGDAGDRATARVWLTEDGGRHWSPVTF